MEVGRCPFLAVYLGIEIGGTKLQLGVGHGGARPLAALRRLQVEPQQDAEGIRGHLQRIAAPLLEQHDIRAVGIGFGGPVDAEAGRTITSHQIEGWTDYPLVSWCRRTFGLPVALGNDSDLAGLAEARFGAGRGHRVVFYTNIGSGIGGALVVDGQLYRGGGGVASELGHLRPGLQCDRPSATVESIASGWAIAAAARNWLTDPGTPGSGLHVKHEDGLPAEPGRRPSAEPHHDDEACAADLLRRCGGAPQRLTAAMVAKAATEGNRVAREIFERACRAFGWAVAQMITLLAPDVVVLGGGVSLAGEALVFGPVRRYIRQYVFAPLRHEFRLVPAELGEEVVLHGALAVAAEARA